MSRAPGCLERVAVERGPPGDASLQSDDLRTGHGFDDFSDQVVPTRAGIEELGVAGHDLPLLGEATSHRRNGDDLCLHLLRLGRADDPLPERDRAGHAFADEEAQDRRLPLPRRGEEDLDRTRRVVARRVVLARPPRADGPVEGLKEDLAREGGLDRHHGVDRVDRERTTGDVFGLELPRGAPPVLRLRACPAGERALLLVRQAVMGGDEPRDDVERVASPREPTDLFRGEAQAYGPAVFQARHGARV